MLTALPNLQNPKNLPNQKAMNHCPPPILLPCPVTTGYQQSEPANVADVGWGEDLIMNGGRSRRSATLAAYDAAGK